MIIWNKTLTCNKTGIYNYSVSCIYMYRSDQFYSYLLTYLTKSIYLTNYTATRRIPAAGRTALLRITMSPHSTCVHHSPSEAASALYSLGQSVSGDIAYLHPREICHRDLKPENVLLSSSEDPNPVLKLSDLGRPDHPICGTENFMTPEMWKKAANGREESEVYSLKVDCWALVIHTVVRSHWVKLLS